MRGWTKREHGRFNFYRVTVSRRHAVCVRRALRRRWNYGQELRGARGAPRARGYVVLWQLALPRYASPSACSRVRAPPLQASGSSLCTRAESAGPRGQNPPLAGDRGGPCSHEQRYAAAVVRA